MAAFANTKIIADQADPLAFCGELVDATFTIGTMGDLVGTYIEAYLCALVKYDIVTNWATLNTIYKKIFSEYACRMIAIEAIKYNMAGYTSRIEAEDIINIHWARCQEIQKLLESQDVQNFLGV
ncbi:MAG: hypothetical protein WC711_04220 [Candidatus Staskawiczbacteria bacterium]|jgi:hypothetical protein